jgi:uncharacterized iron-regulated membrane protein
MAVSAAAVVQAARTCVFWLHLATGAVAGVAIFTMSVTGALLAFQPQVLAWLEREQRAVDAVPMTHELPPSALLEAATNGHTALDGVTLTMSADPATAAVASIGSGQIRYVNPRTGAIVGEGAPRARGWFQSLTAFHRWFAVAPRWRPGARLLTGCSTVALVVLVTSGPLLWIPRNVRRGTVVRSVTLSWPSTARAREFNWHTVVGFWVAPILLVLAATGVVLAFPWANRLLQSVAGTPLPGAPAGPASSRGPVGRALPGPAMDPPSTAPHERIDEAWAIARQQIPTWQTISLRIQGSTEGPLSFTITDAAHWNRFARSQLTVDGTTGMVTRWEPYSRITRGQRWRGWARFAHTGELGGVVGQLLAAAASTGAALLVWTGISLAIRRLARLRAGNARGAARAAILSPEA